MPGVVGIGHVDKDRVLKCGITSISQTHKQFRNTLSSPGVVAAAAPMPISSFRDSKLATSRSP